RPPWPRRPRPYPGPSYPSEALPCRPHPVQKPHPPIWVGGHSKAALRRAARLGDGWHPVGANAAVPLPPSELSGLLDELYRLTEAEGRDPKALTISYKAPVYDLGQKVLGPSGERRPVSGGAAQGADDIAAFARLGGREVVFDVRSESRG